MSILARDAGTNHSDEDAATAQYFRQGEVRARALDNRGPVRYTAQGEVHPEILAAYWHYGFYVFENVLRTEELADVEKDLNDILDRLPTAQDATVDHKGRPAIGVSCKAPTLFWSKPLADPFGGTELANGRHPVKMAEPTPADDAPDEIVYLILGSLQFSNACLRTYGHPDLLRIAAAVNGEDFVPFNEALFIKAPGLGASVAWHQDGTTHWDSPTWDQGSHGFNFMGQLYGCTPANGVWVVPGSHKTGKIDITAKVRAAGTARLPDAVPMVCNPGDVVISNRQILHGSFANTSPDWRVTVNMGFHRHASVFGVRGGGLHAPPATYDAVHIRERSRLIGYGIDARHQRFPDEQPYQYQPFAQLDTPYRWDATAQATLRDYNLLDMSI
jgi:hypothetical protein